MPPRLPLTGLLNRQAGQVRPTSIMAVETCYFVTIDAQFGEGFTNRGTVSCTTEFTDTGTQRTETQDRRCANSEMEHYAVIKVISSA